MLAKVPSILPILIATINYQNACKGCYCTVLAWPFLAILMYAKAILSILADTILILFNTDVMLWMRRCRQSWHTLSYCRWIPASADARPSPTVDRGGLAQPRPPRKLRPPHLIFKISTPDFPNFHTWFSKFYTWFSKFPHLIFKISTFDVKFPHLIFKISHLIFKISTPDFQDFHTWYPKSPHLILKISIPDFQNLHTSTPIFNGAHLTLIQKGTFGQCHRFDLIVWSSIPTSLKLEAIILKLSEKVVLLNRSFLIYMLLCFGPKG